MSAPGSQRHVVAHASPSLALVKYWGKAPGGINLPATSSLAVTLEGLRTVTSVRAAGGANDEMRLNGVLQTPADHTAMIDRFRERAGTTDRVAIESTNTFPTAAGLASSSSGFAALALALDGYFGTSLSRAELSSIAREGSGSASRAVYGGFTIWREGAGHAEPVYPADHWPELRLLIVVINPGKKPVSSRAGMGHARDTSPVYPVWTAESRSIFERGFAAVRDRDLDGLGSAMRDSYLLMFSTMFTSRPPFIYWLPQTVAVIRAAESLRASGVPVWETMDAGPQVKLVTTDQHETSVRDSIAREIPGVTFIAARPGGEPEIVHEA